MPAPENPCREQVPQSERNPCQKDKSSGVGRRLKVGERSRAEVEERREFDPVPDQRRERRDRKSKDEEPHRRQVCYRLPVVQQYCSRDSSAGDQRKHHLPDDTVRCFPLEGGLRPKGGNHYNQRNSHGENSGKADPREGDVPDIQLSRETTQRRRGYGGNGSDGEQETGTETGKPGALCKLAVDGLDLTLSAGLHSKTVSCILCSVKYFSLPNLDKETDQHYHGQDLNQGEADQHLGIRPAPRVPEVVVKREADVVKHPDLRKPEQRDL